MTFELATDGVPAGAGEGFGATVAEVDEPGLDASRDCVPLGRRFLPVSVTVCRWGHYTT